MQENGAPQLIEKEVIPQLNFKNLLEFEQAPNLKHELIEATRLGNSYKGKMRIEFMDDAGAKAVETTIWATGAKYICLKGGVWLPISHIKKVSTL